MIHNFSVELNIILKIKLWMKMKSKIIIIYVKY